MAKQIGIFPITGTVGNLTFYRSKDGIRVRMKSSLDGKRIATTPSFQRTRENMAEFARAARAGKTLRRALASAFQYAATGRVPARLLKQMLRAIKADTTHPRGERTVADGEPGFLQGFEFNEKSPLETTFLAPFMPGIDRQTGVMNVGIPSFVPRNSIARPAGATHFRFVAAGAAINFTENMYVSTHVASQQLPLNATAMAPIDLSVTASPGSTQSLVLAFGIEFYQEINGNMYPLLDSGFNAAALVGITQG